MGAEASRAKNSEKLIEQAESIQAKIMGLSIIPGQAKSGFERKFSHEKIYIFVKIYF